MDLFELAAKQHGVFRGRQAYDLGVTRSRLRSLEHQRIVDDVLPEVFRVSGSVVTWRQRVSVATLWLPNSLASHRAAASLWDVRDFGNAPVEIVTERWTRRHRPAWIVVHESKDLVAADIACRDGIPCTSLVRTLVDLPAVVHEFKAGAALDQASRRDDTLLKRVGDRHREVARRGRNGTVKLRALLAERGIGDQLVDSGFERKALRLIEASGLPCPVTQYQLRDGDEVCYLDLAWLPFKVAMECDSLEYHLSEASFRWERRRRRLIKRLGWSVLEFTYAEVTKEPEMVIRELSRYVS